MKKDHSKRSSKAVADALAGVVASLVALWTFYPIEVIKTKVQAAPAASSHQETNNNLLPSSSKKTDAGFIQKLAAGFGWKTMHTASSSFCYFYLYSWIVSLWTTTSSSSSTGGNSGSTNRIILSTPARLLLSATAAMLNTCLTLPLDVVAARKQTPDKDNNQKEDLRAILWRIQEEDYYDAVDEESNHDSDDDDDDEQEEEKKDDSAVLFEWKADEDYKHIHCPPPEESKLSQVLSLWKGIGPSLLLCSNPAIHYTCFDTMKSRLLSHRQANSSNKNNLTMGEAFVLGLMAKFVATIVTYPLIRTKVMLMVAVTTTSSKSRTSMLHCLRDEYRARGMRGLYQGCNLQLLHTLLKSALLMMIRERLTRTATRMVLGNSNAKSQD